MFQKSSTPAHIDNSVNFQRIFKMPSLSLFGKFGIKESSKISHPKTCRCTTLWNRNF